MTDAGGGWRWDVALSFAGAQRDYVEQVAAALKERGLRCFYDADEQIELWGKYLAEELPGIYGEQAAAVVVFISAEYVERDWTQLERRAALDRAVRERRDYVLPARFDDTPVPGLLSGVVTVDLLGQSPRQFAGVVAAKLAALGITGPGPAARADVPARASSGDADSAGHLADLLSERGELDEALQVLLAAADAGRVDRKQLADLLAKQGQPQKAEQLRRFGLNPDGSIACE